MREQLRPIEHLRLVYWLKNLRGMLKKATSGIPCLRRTPFAKVATKAESGFAQAGRPCWTDFFFGHSRRLRISISIKSCPM